MSIRVALLTVAVVVGLPASYVLNRAFSGRWHAYSRRKSLAVAIAVWIDGLIGLGLLLLLPSSYFSVILGAWMLANAIVILLLISRNGKGRSDARST